MISNSPVITLYPDIIKVFSYGNMRNHRIKNKKEPDIILIKDFMRMMLPSLIIFTVFIIIIFALFTPFIEKQHMQNKEEACRHLVEVTIDYISSLNDDVKEGIITEKEAKDRAFKRIRRLRYGKDKRDYFWIIDRNGVMLMHPFRTDIENRDPDTITGPDGQALSKLMLKMAHIANVNPKGDTIKYIWNRWEDLSQFGTKLSYVKKFQPWDWIIGTGVYIDEAEKEIRTLKKIFISAAILLALFSSVISLALSYRAGNSRKKEEAARELLLESEKNLRIREELFRSIFEKSPHAIVITDISNTRIINANRAFAVMTGYCQEDIREGVPYKKIHPISQAELYQIGEGIDSAGVAENIGSILFTREGNKKNIIYSAIPINYMGENCLLRMIVDLTEEKFLEEQLRQSQKMEVIGRLAGGVAHDFNNMLGVIMGSAELLSLKITPDKDESKYITRILNTGEKASGLIRKLMLFSRKGGAVFRNFDIHDTILTVADILGHTIDKKINISMNLAAETSRISGDPTLIENALLNIAINSRDAMPEGGEIRFSTSNIDIDEYFVRNHPYSICEGRYIAINISDTGQGIEPALIEKIFEPFFTTKPSGKGTGLGLAAVYGTIKEHKGTIDVYSEPNKGTVFKLYLPCDIEHAESKTNDEPMLIHGDATVLIIDDDENILTNLGEMLTDLGYTVVPASGGKEGTDIFRERTDEIDLVICDIIMPEIDGIETIKLLKSIKKDINVIISSGFQDEHTAGQLNEVKVAGFIQKPFKMNELSRTVHSVLTGEDKA
mgnify:CR=1 FL=1